MDMDGNYSTSRSRSRSKSKAYDCGSSPELLTNWWMEEHSSSSGINLSGGAMMMGGELLNGSRIWFPLSQTGTLAGSTRPSWSHVLYSDAASSTSPPCRCRRQISILICFLPSRLVATSTSLGCQQFQCHLLLHVSILIIYMLLVLIVRLALAGN